MEKIMQKERIPITLAAVLLAVSLMLALHYNLFSVFWNQRPQTAVTVNAAAVNTIDKPIAIVRTGSVQNATTVPVNSEFSGRVAEVYVTEGQHVKAGQQLFKLQPVSTSSVSSEPAVTTSPNTAPSQQALDNYNKALQEFNRYQKLYELGGIPRLQLENAKARLQAAQAALSGSQNAEAPAPAPAKTTVTGNSTATIAAPVEGIVTGLRAAEGNIVQAGQQLMALGSGQEVELVVKLNQQDLYLVHLGTPATIEISNQTVTGQVSSIYPEVEGNQVSSFLAHIKITNNLAGVLKPGMSANVRINTGDSVPVLAVPTAAIVQDEQGQKFIYVIENARAVRLPVATGETIGDFTEITSNLPQQSMVITSNLEQIQNGAAIIVQ